MSCENCKELEQTVERLRKEADGAVEIQRHRDAWRGYAYGRWAKPQDFLDGNLVERPPTRQETLEAEAAALRRALEQTQAGLTDMVGSGCDRDRMNTLRIAAAKALATDAGKAITRELNEAKCDLESYKGQCEKIDEALAKLTANEGGLARVRLVKAMLEEVRDLRAKLEFVLRYVSTEEGKFTFPDGDIWDASSCVEPEEVAQRAAHLAHRVKELHAEKEKMLEVVEAAKEVIAWPLCKACDTGRQDDLRDALERAGMLG